MIHAVSSFLHYCMSFGEGGDDDDDDVMPTLRVSWKAKKTDESNGGYSQKILEEIFFKVF